jgi:hypothetical protein
MCAQSVKNLLPLRCVLPFLEAAAGVVLDFQRLFLFCLAVLFRDASAVSRCYPRGGAPEPRTYPAYRTCCL